MLLSPRGRRTAPSLQLWLGPTLVVRSERGVFSCRPYRVKPAPRDEPVHTAAIADRNRARGRRVTLDFVVGLGAAVGALLAAVLIGPGTSRRFEVFGASPDA